MFKRVIQEKPEHLIPGVPLPPMLAKPAPKIEDVMKFCALMSKKGVKEVFSDFKYDGERT